MNDIGKLDMGTVGTPSTDEKRKMRYRRVAWRLKQLLHITDILTEWECDFCNDLVLRMKQGVHLSSKQVIVCCNIWSDKNSQSYPHIKLLDGEM